MKDYSKNILINYILKVFKIIKYVLFFTKQEKYLIKNLKKNCKSFNNKKIILVNCTEDYQTACFGYLLSLEKKFSDNNIVGFLPLPAWIRISRKNIVLFTISFYLKLIVVLLRNKKWKKLHSKFCNEFISFLNFNLIEELTNIKRAEKLLKKVKNTSDLKKIKYKGIVVGDIMYDTYLRYYDVHTIDLKNPFVSEILGKIIYYYKKIEQLNKNYSIERYFTNQIAYIHNGLISKLFLRYKIEVNNFMWFSGSNITKLKNYNYPYYAKSYRSYFKKLKKKKQKLILSKSLLEKKFNGSIISQERFMPYSVFKKNKIKIPNFKIVVFLHCFVDSPVTRGKTLFTDFYEWTTETLDFFENKNISHNIAIKPHPGGQSASFRIVDKLKKKYSKFIWLDEKTSNSSIFDSKPIMGISVMGTVLYELAFHGIHSLAAGENLFMDYDFVFTPKSRKQYFSQIEKKLYLKKHNLVTNKKKYRNQVYEYFYCQHIHDFSHMRLISSNIKLKDWDFLNSKVLINFTNFINESLKIKNII
jgi:hypothetical protein